MIIHQYTMMSLKENCNAETSKLISTKRPFKTLQNDSKIIKYAKPFLRYLTLKIDIQTVFQEKTTQKPRMLCL